MKFRIYMIFFCTQFNPFLHIESIKQSWRGDFCNIWAKVVEKKCGRFDKWLGFNNKSRILCIHDTILCNLKKLFSAAPLSPLALTRCSVLCILTNIPMLSSVTRNSIKCHFLHCSLARSLFYIFISIIQSISFNFSFLYCTLGFGRLLVDGKNILIEFNVSNGWIRVSPRHDEMSWGKNIKKSYSLFFTLILRTLCSALTLIEEVSTYQIHRRFVFVQSSRRLERAFTPRQHRWGTLVWTANGHVNKVSDFRCKSYVVIRRAAVAAAEWRGKMKCRQFHIWH